MNEKYVQDLIDALREELLEEIRMRVDNAEEHRTEMLHTLRHEIRDLRDELGMMRIRMRD